MRYNLFILLLAILFFSGCSESEKIKIGIMTPTSGNLAFLGENIVRSAELAVEELGYADRVELVVEDSGNVGGGAQSINAYRRLVDVEGVKIIIGGMASDGTMAVAPLLDEDKVVMITPLTGGKNIDNAAEYLFRNGPSDIHAGTKPAEDLIELFSFNAVALFTDNAEYTLDISTHFRDTYSGDIIVDEIIIPDQTDYRAEIAKITNVDAIVTNTASGTSAAYIIKQLFESGNEIPIFANFLAYNENSIQIAGNGLEGVYVYDPIFDAERARDFFSDYAEQFGTEPTIPFHSTGTYDVIRMSVEAVDAVGYDGEAIQKYLLTNIKEWDGMNGVVTFDEKGNVNTGFELKQVQNGELVTIETLI